MPWTGGVRSSTVTTEGFIPSLLKVLWKKAHISFCQFSSSTMTPVDNFRNLFFLFPDSKFLDAHRQLGLRQQEQQAQRDHLEVGEREGLSSWCYAVLAYYFTAKKEENGEKVASHIRPFQVFNSFQEAEECACLEQQERSSWISSYSGAACLKRKFLSTPKEDMLVKKWKRSWEQHFRPVGLILSEVRTL